MTLTTSDTETWFAEHFVAERFGHEIDYLSEDGRVAIELKRSIGGTRDLHVAVMQLALYLSKAEARQAWVVALESKLTPSRLDAEWKRLTQVLRPDVAHRLALFVLEPAGSSKSWHSAPLGKLAPLQDMARSFPDRAPHSQSRREALPTPKFFDVFKVLLSTWLGRRGPLAINQLIDLAGAAHPTVSEALERLAHRNELTRHRNRSVELRAWPHTTLAELIPLLPVLRQTQWFTDSSGRSGSAEALLRRLRKAKPDAAAIGGVEAARALDPSFDLVGLPRLDITLHAPDGVDQGTLAQKLDAALVRSDTPQGAALAVHMLTRRAPLFIETKNGVPWADAAETLLDLNELRLHEQARDLVRTLRAEKSR